MKFCEAVFFVFVDITSMTHRLRNLKKTEALLSMENNISEISVDYKNMIYD